MPSDAPSAPPAPSQAQGGPASHTIQVTVKTPSAQEDFSVAQDATVAQFKEKIAARFGGRPDQLVMVSMGRILRDGDTLRQRGVRDGFTVHLVLQPRRPGPFQDPRARDWLPPRPASAAPARMPPGGPERRAPGLEGPPPGFVLGSLLDPLLFNAHLMRGAPPDRSNGLPYPDPPQPTRSPAFQTLDHLPEGDPGLAHASARPGPNPPPPPRAPARHPRAKETHRPQDHRGPRAAKTGARGSLVGGTCAIQLPAAGPAPTPGEAGGRSGPDPGLLPSADPPAAARGGPANPPPLPGDSGLSDRLTQQLPAVLRLVQLAETLLALSNPDVAQALQQIEGGLHTLAVETPTLLPWLDSGAPGLRQDRPGGMEVTRTGPDVPDTSDPPSQPVTALQRLQALAGGAPQHLQPPEIRFHQQLERLGAMGFSNREHNLQALMATEGDTRAAARRLQRPPAA
ncbi:ubiquilin-4-like [Ornithorhynchus anatinus]|uniref:ubiquilin-4-like n=1 Tax=Ornithorhynchus anatinus TaxID=9258 RepID=UPI0001554E1F|nr:ubiquilin-4-like [Ornithorhynchus anatinus]